VNGFARDIVKHGAHGRLAVLVSSALVMAGCTTGGIGQGPWSEKPPPAKVAANPANDARDVSPSAPIDMGVTGGKLTKVMLTNSDGKQINGKLARDGLHWTPSEQLEYGKTYTWSGNATNADGQATPVNGRFTTANPGNLVRGTVNIDDGNTVGIAAPVMIQFDGQVQDKAAAEKALSIQTSVPTEGSWAWLPDSEEGSRAHWRPKNYWKSGTQVTVNAALFGVPFGGGAYGKDNVTTHFTIGRSQIVKGDASSHHLVVQRDGQQVADYPASYGLDSSPDRNTRTGIHVVTGKSAMQRMSSRQYGYDTQEPNAVQINNNGEFIHTNMESVGQQGSSNVTHGCINLNDTDGKAYFESAMYGDPVEVTNTGVQLSAADGDIYDWTIPWDQWQSMSAVKQAPKPAPSNAALRPPG
jgi:lipoprotein-anchoring transpeptidase ErfK/SrfK